MPALALVVAAALTAATPAAPTRWVEDHAAAMSPAARDALDARLESYQHATGHQVVVWIDHTLGGADLADWAVRTFTAWHLGRAGSDDGIAVFVLTDDRKIDVEVGYGLEALVTDAVAARIIRDVMAPRMRAGDADAAIRDGADAVLAAIEGHAWRVGDPPAILDEEPPTALWIVGGIALAALIILFITHPRLLLLLLWFGRWGGGGRGGGRGGGFTGGGGRSGGGGARGGW